MKRDMDLVRKILLEIEEAPFSGGWLDFDLEGYDESELSYHTMLLDEAGLIEAIDLSSMNTVIWKPKHLTWEGHEFLEASRDESRWKKALTIMKEKGGGMAFDVLKGVLIQLMTRAVMGWK